MSNYQANTVMKQFSNSATLLYLLTVSDQWMNAALFSSQFLTNVWDISQAQGFGLDIWGRILGVSRYLQISSPLAGRFFGWNIAPVQVTGLRFATGNGSSVTFTVTGASGAPVTPLAGAQFYVNGVLASATTSGTQVTFATAPANGTALTWAGGYNLTGTNWLPWSQAPFWSGATTGTVSYALSDTYYRQLLLVKAAANIATCDPPSINALMRAMFGARGVCYVGYDIANPMNIAYHYGFFPTAVEIAIIQSGLFPQPAGTTATYVYQQLTYTPFGFAGANTGANPDAVNPWSTHNSPFYSTTNVHPLP